MKLQVAQQRFCLCLLLIISSCHPIYADAAIRGMGEIFDFIFYFINLLFFLILLPFSLIFKNRSLVKFTVLNIIIFGLLQWWKYEMEDNEVDTLVDMFVQSQVILLFISLVIWGIRIRKVQN